MSNRIRRVTKELGDIRADNMAGFFVQAVNDQDTTHLRASFPGPPDTPYEGGVYIVDIKIPLEYPFRPPAMKFTTKLWHPNVSSQTGAICLDTIGTAWSPVLTIKSALLSLQSLLETPEPKDPQDAEVAAMLMNEPERFQQKAREWALKYAGAPTVTAWSMRTPKASASASSTKPKSQPQLSREEQARQNERIYQGYNKSLIDRFVSMGFGIERVVDAFNFVGIDRNGGEDYELEEAYMGDITARLLGEP